MSQSSLPAGYAAAAAELQGLVLSAEQLAEVEQQLARIAQIAAEFIDLPLAADQEPILVMQPGSAP